MSVETGDHHSQRPSGESGGNGAHQPATSTGRHASSNQGSAAGVSGTHRHRRVLDGGIGDAAAVVPGRSCPRDPDLGRRGARRRDHRLMPRQSGKNQLSAHLEAYLLIRRQRRGGSLVKCAPTFQPQVLVSIGPAAAGAGQPADARALAHRRDGHVVELGRASIAFYSAEPGANVVGGTASLLLECDEAQDVHPDKWEKDFRPMGATANATSVLYGTPWTDDTLLARQIAREPRGRGSRRHPPPLPGRLDGRGARSTRPTAATSRPRSTRLGEHHPIVRTQYLLRTVAGGGRFLDAGQLELLIGDHPPEDRAVVAPAGPGAYVAGIDVAGEDEEDPSGEAVRVNPRRDSTVLTIAYAAQERVERAGAGATLRGGSAVRLAR